MYRPDCTRWGDGPWFYIILILSILQNRDISECYTPHDATPGLGLQCSPSQTNCKHRGERQHPVTDVK